MTHKDKNLSRLILALRPRNALDWVLETTPFDDVHQILLQRIRDNAEIRLVERLIHASSCMPSEHQVERCALECGWHRHGKFWFPIEEPLPLPPPLNLETTDITFTVKELLFGTITVEVTAGAKHLELVFDDVYDNPVVLVRFIQVLMAGGRPHAAMADSTWCDFVIDDGPTPDLSRLVIDNDNPDRKARIDIFTDRAALIDAFRGLALEIGEHPNFAHHFLHHVCLPDEHYEKVANAHGRDWADGAQRGIYPDDYDAEKASLGARVVEHVPLPLEGSQEAIRYRDMMKSLEIPRDWQLRFGLIGFDLSDDVDQILN